MNISDINKIQSRDDFLRFMEIIRMDLQKNEINWVNDELPNYLEAIQSWIKDMDGFYENMNQEKPEFIDWSFLATVLIAAKFYE